MLQLIPAGLHRALYRAAHRVRHRLRQTFRLPIFGVSAVLSDEQGRVLLVRHSYGPESWALPGGGHRRSEDPGQAVRREISEELGLEIEGLELIFVAQETVSGAPHLASIFAGIVRGEPRPDGREVVAAQFFTLDALPLMPNGPSRRSLDIWKTYKLRSSEAGQSNDSWA